jgi:hypothetical protein
MNASPTASPPPPRRDRLSPIFKPLLKRGFLGASLAVGLGTASAMLFPAACATHQCDSSGYAFSGGHMLDANTWVSNDWDEHWLAYPGNGTIFFTFPPELANRVPKPPIALVGTDPTPNGGDAFVGGDNYIVAVGQLAYYNFLTTTPPSTDAGPILGADGGVLNGGGFWALNATCADYFARFEVDFVPLDGAGAPVDDAGMATGPVDGAVDGGAGDGATDAGTSDASSDGSPADATLSDATLPDATVSDAAATDAD